MNTETIRRYAQIALAAVAVVSALGAAYSFLVRENSPFGPHVVAIPAAGPVGMRPFLEFPGYSKGPKVGVFLCASTVGGVQDCQKIGTGTGGLRLRAKQIPKELPDTTQVLPGQYVLRAGPTDKGEYPERGKFDVVAFKVGARPHPASFAGLAPGSLRIGDARAVAKGAPCRPPLFLSDGRLAVGSTVVDPTTGVTIEFDLPADELDWSPTGDKLAILTSDRKEIRLAAPDGSGAVAKVREARGFLSSLSWSPDGEHLAFIAGPDPSTRQLVGDPTSPTVWILNATSGEITHAGPGLAVSWAPNQDVLAVEMAGARIQLSTLNGGRKDLTTGRRPGWSPDGSYVTVIRTAPSGAEQGWVVPAQGGDGAVIGGGGVCALTFSPSGTSLAIVADQEGKTTLLLRTVDKPATGAP